MKKSPRKKFSLLLAGLCCGSLFFSQMLFMPKANAMSLLEFIHMTTMIHGFVTALPDPQPDKETFANHDDSRWVSFGANHQVEAEDNPDDMFITIEPGINPGDYTYDYDFTDDQ